MVREDRETASLQHETEVFDGGHHSKELPVKCTVVNLSLVQLGRKESKGAPSLPRPLLLYNRANMGRGGVRHQGKFSTVDWVPQNRG